MKLKNVVQSETLVIKVVHVDGLNRMNSSHLTSITIVILSFEDKKLYQSKKSLVQSIVTWKIVNGL